MKAISVIISTMFENTIIIYRGNLERARMTFILKAVSQISKDIRVVWVNPGKVPERYLKLGHDFFSSFGINELLFLNHTYMDIGKTKKKIKDAGLNQCELLCCIGFSSLPFSRMFESKKKIWFVNGVPEEKQSTGKSWQNRVKPFIQWKLNHFAGEPDLTVTVSSYMKRHVIDRLGYKNHFIAPTCVNLKVFKKGDANISNRKYFTYLGSAAPWQALDLLSDVWGEIHKLNKDIKFRVISRDENSKILGKHIDGNNIEFVASDDFEEISNYLHEGICGFLLRRDDIVNKVSFPTKLGEYAATGNWIVSSAIDWDLNAYFREYKIGVLVDPESNPQQIANEVLSFHEKVCNGEINLQLIECTSNLDIEHWVGMFKEISCEVLSR